MSNRITFQFDDHLDYQLQAIQSVVELFSGLQKNSSSLYKTQHTHSLMKYVAVRNPSIMGDNRLKTNLNRVQLDNDLFADHNLAPNHNFTIEMETGTGKTYVYLRSILELHKEYQFKKFMIVVPSVAIRKGVEKSIDQLKDHFKALYDVDLTKHSFVYDSNNPQKVSTNLVESNTLSICVLNIQAFNKDNNKIRTEDEGGKILWNEIKYVQPIVIIDEPQKLEGTKKDKSKSLKAIEELEPLFTLRYSATHKQLYNQVYKLDSYAAYQQNLVKKIQVKTVHGITPKDYPYVRYVEFTKELKARIEIFSQKQGGPICFTSFAVGGNASLEDLSGGLPQYKGMRIAEEPHKLQPLKISTPVEPLFLEKGQGNDNIELSDTVRIQIRLAIKNHLIKQLSILETGKIIKTLALFFVDSVAKVRDTNAPDGRGEYLKIFDDEYSREYDRFIKNNRSRLQNFASYFPVQPNIQAVREGYFAIDKNKKAVDVDGWNPTEEDVKLNKKPQEDVDRGIELILEKKDELISFNEPLAFIFSHSALREGWDNPNVFTLCTLKAGGSDLAKKQEIGRGLRLPVDITGNRCLDESINELTVIANDYYEDFAAALHRDFNDKSGFNKNEVTADILQNALRKAGLPLALITSELVDTFRNELVQNGILNEKNLLFKSMEDTTDLLENLTFIDKTLAAHVIKIKEEFTTLMVQKGSRKIDITNGDNEPFPNQIRSFINENEFATFYQTLTSQLTKRSIYKFKIEKDQFIAECAEELNVYLKSLADRIKFVVESGKAGYTEAQLFELEKAIDEDIETATEIHLLPKSDFEIANYIMYHTMLPRLAIFKIINGINKRELLNNQDILDTVTQKILVKLKDVKAANVVSYEVIDGYELETAQIFGVDTISIEDFEKHARVFHADQHKKRAVNDYYKLDSDGELDFAKHLEADDNVLLFTKLKKGGFVIDTPYGNYSPDWAIVYREEGLKDGEVSIYFIVETKAEKEQSDLTPVENSKIKCGKLHFKAVSDLVKFDWVNSYKDFKEKFGVR